MSFTRDDFLSGQYDDNFKILSLYSDNKYTNLNTGKDYGYYDKVWRGVPFLATAKSIWLGTLDGNKTEVIINEKDDASDSTKKANNRLKKKTKKFLYSDKQWAKVESEGMEMKMKEGWCAILIDEDGMPLVRSMRRYAVYHDWVNNTTKYRLIVDGAEVGEYLTHGVEIYVMKDFGFSSSIIPPSRLDTVYSYLTLHNKGLETNISFADNDWNGTTLLKVHERFLTEKGLGKDKTGKNIIERIMDNWKSKFKGTKNAGKFTVIPELDSAIELGKSNKDMQYLEMNKRTLEVLISVYNLAPADYGQGDAQTWSNVATFNYSRHDKIGQHEAQAFDDCRNNWFLPLFNIQTNENFYVQYPIPEDPNDIEKQKQAREDYLVDALSRNQYLVATGRDPEEEDFYYSEVLQKQNQGFGQTVEAEFKKKN